ncbi:MAG: nucleotidyltransferase domain-containing protein [Sulfurimonas sp.]|nr:nucleotidyltransferase domain-containing protein [Sulfurimonas sp.]
MRADKSSILDYLKELKPLLNNRGISVVGFFGSFAREENSVYSDIDVAIKKEKDYLTVKSGYDYFNDIEFLKNLIRKKFHRNIDIFDIDSNSNMKNDILKDMIYV